MRTVPVGLDQLEVTPQRRQYQIHEIPILQYLIWDAVHLTHRRHKFLVREMVTMCRGVFRQVRCRAVGREEMNWLEPLRSQPPHQLETDQGIHAVTEDREGAVEMAPQAVQEAPNQQIHRVDHRFAEAICPGRAAVSAQPPRTKEGG